MSGLHMDAGAANWGGGAAGVGKLCCLAVLVVPASPYLVAAARRYGVFLKGWTVTLRCAHRHAPCAAPRRVCISAGGVVSLKLAKELCAVSEWALMELCEASRRALLRSAADQNRVTE